MTVKLPVATSQVHDIPHAADYAAGFRESFDFHEASEKAAHDERLKKSVNFAVLKQYVARQEMMATLPNADATIPELKDRIAKTIDFLKGLKPAQIDGSEDKEIKITFPSGAVREFTGQSLLLGNSLPNFYFHCTTAYDIARHCGIELGKRDFMGTPVSL